MASEFDLIARYFTRSGAGRDDVVLGIGDDAAIVRASADRELLVSMDTLISGVHFSPDVDAESLGHKALAVNLSDLAAMGAEPAWAMLSLTLPQSDERWLEKFCRGFFDLAREYDIELIGGDTTRGPLSITVQIHGLAPPGAAFRRGGAQAGDRIYVTGTLGDAGLALLLAQAGRADCPCSPEDIGFLKQRLERPRPRVREAMSLRGLIHAAIDISDGLAADLGHVLAASGVGATLTLRDLPLSPAYRRCLNDLIADGAGHPDPRFRGGDAALAWADLALASGDDYELCFTAAPHHQARMEKALAGTACTCIGVIEPHAGLRCLLEDGAGYEPPTGYDHFDGSGSLSPLPSGTSSRRRDPGR